MPLLPVRQNIFTLILVYLFLAGCSKKEDAVATTETTLQFMANGITYTWNGNLDELKTHGSVIKKVPNWPLYRLIARPAGEENIKRLEFMIGLKTITETAFYKENGTDDPFVNALDICGLPGNNILYAAYMKGDFEKIIFTSIHNGYADGIFLARFSAQDGSASLEIRDGSFKNVKITE